MASFSVMLSKDIFSKIYFPDVWKPNLIRMKNLNLFTVSNEAKFHLPDHFFHKCDEIIDPYHVTSWFKLNIYLTTSFSFFFFSMN